jgi:2-octaprenyl-6-methoxyphenol hydroxylase
MSDTSDTSDIIVVGTGSAGLASALGLAQAGWRVTLIGRTDLRRSARTVALFDRSLRLFENLGVIDRLRPDFAALEIMRIVDDTGSLFRTPPVEFRAGEIGLDVFGENIESHLLLGHLLDAARATPGLTVIDGEVTHAVVDETGADVLLDDGRRFRARLLVAADGRKSLLRKAAGIATREWSYPQVALTALLSHDRPHRDVSTEFHTRQGPFTLVPLPAKPGAPHRSSLVWMMDPREARRRQAMDDAHLTREMNQQSHFLLGRLALEGPRGAFPMSGLVAEQFAARRTALVGDAAHGFPPIGAQGLNLGLRDVAHLVDSLTPGEDPGGDEALARYQASRVSDVRSRVAGVDMLNRSLLNGFLPVDALRGFGLFALANIRPLRRMIMREGVAPRGLPPRLMRAQNAANRL